MRDLKSDPEDCVMVEEMKPGQIEALLDREARELLNISGEEFKRRWNAGDYMNADDPKLTDLAILLP